MKRVWHQNTTINYLLQVFWRDQDQLLLMAAADTTRRHNLIILLDYPRCLDPGYEFHGKVNYNKRERRFDFIEFGDEHGWVVRVSITSGIYWSAWEHRNFLYQQVPEFYHHGKKLTTWLLTH